MSKELIFKKEKKRDERIMYHYREFKLGNKTYKLEYCSGHSFVATGRSDQLFMNMCIIRDSEPEKNEIYVLRRYPYNEKTAVVQHISIDTKTDEVENIEGIDSLEEFLEGFKSNMGELLCSFPEYPPMRKLLGYAPDYQLMEMYFDEILLLERD